MKINKLYVDVSSLNYKITGIGQYTISLLVAMAELRPDIEFVLLSPYKLNYCFNKINIIEHNHYQVKSNAHIIGWRIFWFEFVLPFILYKNSVANFWAATGQSPFLKNSHTKVFLTVYDFAPLFYPKTLTWWNAFYKKYNTKYAIRNADKVFPMSRSTEADMLKLYHRNGDAIIYAGVEKIFSDFNQFSTPDNYFLVVGTLEPRKNLSALFSAISRLYKEGFWPEKLKVKVVGSKGWRDDDIQLQISQLLDKEIIVKMGYIDRSELPVLMARSLALLMPSVYEGFGMPIIEAGSTATSIICSRIPPFLEITSSISPYFHETDTTSIYNLFKDLILPNINSLVRKRIDLSEFDWNKSAQQFISKIEQ